MSDLQKRLFRRLTGTSLEDLETTRPRLKDIEHRALKQLSSRYQLRFLGNATDGESFFTEEQREAHIHIIGSPGEGKSKFLEHFIRQDIERGYGACLLDPSDNGDTAYKILHYCAKIGFEKVCLIDPHHRFGDYSVVPGINPLHEGAPSSVVAGNMMDTVRTLWNTKDFAETARIQKYLPAVIHALHQSKLTLHELIYFTDNTNLTYRSRRERILEKLHPLDRFRITLEQVFYNKNTFANEFSSSIRRAEPFLEDTMKLIFGTKDGINFSKMITEGWLILVNLDPEGIFGQEHQRLLGTIVINELTYAIHRLRANGWKGVYYLYIDEVGDYATPKLAYLLDKKRKSGLRLTLAHQGFDQIGDQQVLSAVYRSAKTKVLFNTKDPSDQKKMISMMYGGALNSEATRYTLMTLKKQHAVIKVDKDDPHVTRIPDVPDVRVSPDAIRDYINKIYRNEWYHHPKTVLNEINARFKEPTGGGVVRPKKTNTRSFAQAATHDGSSVGKTAPVRPKGKPAKDYFSQRKTKKGV